MRDGWAAWPAYSKQETRSNFMTLMLRSGVFYVFDSMASSSAYDHSSELMFFCVDSCLMWIYRFLLFTGPSERNADLRGRNHGPHERFPNPFITLSSNRITAYAENWLTVKNYVGPLHHLRHWATLPNVPKDATDICPIPFFITKWHEILLLNNESKMKFNVVTYHGKTFPTAYIFSYNKQPLCFVTCSRYIVIFNSYFFSKLTFVCVLGPDLMAIIKKMKKIKQFCV